MPRQTLCLSVLSLSVHGNPGKEFHLPNGLIQVMARGLGGRVGRNTSGRFVLTGATSHPKTSGSCALTDQCLQSHVAQILGLCSVAVEELRLEPGFQRKPYFVTAAGSEELSSEQSSSLRVLESHGDQVSICQL